MLQNFANFIVELVHDWSYGGIFFMMFLESSALIPFPSEVAMIPAGYLASQGKMSVMLAWLAGTAGSLLGATFNYYICYFFGRGLIDRYGKYVGLNDQKMAKFEEFFEKHGEISTFNCRLIPGIRQYISLPAGLAKMNFAKFAFFTTLGAGIWMAILLALGYFLGENMDFVKEQLHIIIIALLVLVMLSFIVYFLFYRYKKAK
ncbi:MAG: DedA family protein [Campylobacter sp.]|nr:DedA family protein [Campylobacter sp.]